MWKPFHTWFVQVAFLLHSHYDLLWQIIHYNRYQQPGLVHLTIFWQDRDKMAPKCDVIVTTVACRSYFWKRETEVTEKPSATKTLRNHWKKKKQFNIWDRRALVCRFRSLLSRTLWSIDGLIAVGAGCWGDPQAWGGLRAGMRERGADKQGKAGDLRSPGSPHPGSPGNVQASLQIRIWKREITSLLPPGRGTGAREESRRVCMCEESGRVCLF